MIIAVGYKKFAHWKIKSTSFFWLKIRENLSYTIMPTIHAVTLILVLNSGINNLPFLLLYEAKMLGNWLQNFRENVGSHFEKVIMFPSIFPAEDLTVIFNRNVQKNYPVTRVSNSTFSCIVEEIDGICGTHGS
jgi:hypothetical protein